MTLKSNLTRALGMAPRARPAAALYARGVELARRPEWYAAGGVPDTLDGRFEMIALVVALVIARAQALGLAQLEADLADRFAEDMDASLREVGVGDLSIAKQVGRAIGALGGRIGVYRAGLDGGDLAAALTRNLYSGVDPGATTLGWTEREVRALWAGLGATQADALAAGRI